MRYRKVGYIARSATMIRFAKRVSETFQVSAISFIFDFMSLNAVCRVSCNIVANFVRYRVIRRMTFSTTAIDRASKVGPRGAQSVAPRLEDLGFHGCSGSEKPLSSSNSPPTSPVGIGEDDSARHSSCIPGSSDLKHLQLLCYFSDALGVG